MYGSVAQRIEQLPSKQLVVGSNPARATNQQKWGYEKEMVINYKYHDHDIVITKIKNASRLTTLIDGSEVVINTNNVEEAKRLIKHTLRDRTCGDINGRDHLRGKRDTPD